VRDAYTASAYRRAGPMITLATSYACRSGNWCLDPITGETQNQVAVAHGGSDDLVTATCSSVALVNAGKCAANLGESLRRFRRQRCPAYQQRRTAHQQTWYICHYRSIRGIFLTEGFQATIRLPEVPPVTAPHAVACPRGAFSYRGLLKPNSLAQTCGSAASCTKGHAADSRNDRFPVVVTRCRRDRVRRSSNGLRSQLFAPIRPPR
jgi:hypothetical protein